MNEIIATTEAENIAITSIMSDVIQTIKDNL